MFSNDDDAVECPYNKAHRMLRRRLQSHLLKCRRNYPDVELRKCPFNITHLIPEPEFTYHATNCPDRKLITQYKYDAPEPKEEEVPKHAPIECDEDWDDTDVNDYDPRKYVERANVIRKPEGGNNSENKKFIKKERKRLGDGDDSSDNESVKSETIKVKSGSPASYRRCDIKEESDDFEGSRRSNFLRSNRFRRSRSPTAPYLKQYSHSASSRFERGRLRSRSPIDYRRSYTNPSSPPRRSPDFSRPYSPPPHRSLDYSRPYSSPPRRSLDYSRPYSPPPDSLRRTMYYNPDRDPYYNGGRCQDSNNLPYFNSYTGTNTLLLPQAPPPPMISYPVRPYLNTK